MPTIDGNRLLYNFSSPDSEYHFYNFTSPHLLTREQIKRDIEARKRIVIDYLLEEKIQPTFYSEVPVFVLFNQSFNERVLFNPLNRLANHENPDFIITVAIRILYTTDVYTDALMEQIAKIPLWITEGEPKLLYWTENHHILFTTSAYLLRQKFNDRLPDDYFDENLDKRLQWILRVKQTERLFEFNSPIYMRLSLLGLINLYDFAEDPAIKEGARKCVIRIFKDWLQHTNSDGVGAVSSGRTNQLFYYRDKEMYGPGFQQILFIATGLGLFEKFFPQLESGTVALLLSDIDISEAVMSYTPEESFNRVSVGGKDDELFAPLEGDQRTVIEVSMGSYVHYKYVNAFYNLFKNNNMMNHKLMEGEGQILEALTFPFMRRLVSSAGSTRTSASLLIVPSIAIYKKDAVMLTSCENYFPGFKGYQQMPGMAIIKNTSAFTYAMSESHFMDIDLGTSQTANNNQMPKLVQRMNIQLALYNPNLDSAILGVTGQEVLFYMNFSHYEEVVIDREWVFGRLEESYVAVRRHCINNTESHVYTRCDDVRQAWLIGVGDAEKYGDFESFSGVFSNAAIDVVDTRGCIYFTGSVDGYLFDESMCRSMGSFTLLLIVVLLVFILGISCCCFYCKKVRKSNAGEEKDEERSL